MTGRGRRWISAILVPAAFFLLAETGILVRAEVRTIRFYQTWVSPVLGMVATCRFDPTCSQYALHALENRGFWQGNLMIGGRLLYCSPAGYLLDRGLRSSRGPREAPGSQRADRET